MSFEDVKYEVAIATRVLAETGLASGVNLTMGHASLRVPDHPDRFVIKGRGYALDALAVMKPEDMVVCDLEGYKVEGPPGVSQCYEVKMHSCIYRARSNVQSIVHVHPRFVVLMSLLGMKLTPMAGALTDVPVYPHSKLIVTDEDGTGVAQTLGDRQAVMLAGHGAATTGSGLEESITTMLQLEQQCEMNWHALVAAGPGHPALSEALALERRNQPGYETLPHFEATAGGRRGRINGFWTYYRDLIAKGM